MHQATRHDFPVEPASSLPRAATRLGGRAAASFLVLTLVGLSPTGADWLVTRDGARVETKGEWEVRGRRIIFSKPDGTLASIRLSEVDLDASERASAAAKAPPKETRAADPAATPKRDPVLVLTDADVRSAGRSPRASEGSEAPEQGQGQQTDDSKIKVTSWSDEYNAEENQLEISGEIRNTGSSTVTRFNLTVLAYDEAGNPISSVEATFEEDYLRPGDSSQFMAVFPALARFDSIKFKAASRGFSSMRPKTEEGEGESPP